MRSNNFTPILTLILGIILIFVPGDILKTVIRFTGLFVIILSSFNAYYSFNNSNNIELSYNIMLIILGLILFTTPTVIASIIPFVIGAWLVLRSILKLQIIRTTYIKDNAVYKRSLTINIISLLLGIFLFFNPFKGATLMLRAIGIILSIYSIAQFFDFKDDKPKKVKVIE